MDLEWAIGPASWVLHVEPYVCGVALLSCLCLAAWLISRPHSG